MFTWNSRAGEAEKEYALRRPNANVFRHLEHRLRDTGSVTRKGRVNKCLPRTSRTPANEDAITAADHQSRRISKAIYHEKCGCLNRDPRNISR
jgi:hypothetical protein